MVIYILIGLIILLFLIIGGLFALVLKPEWLARIQNLLTQRSNINSSANIISSTLSPEEIVFASEQEFKDKKSEINQRLDKIETNYSDILSSNGVHLRDIVVTVKSLLDKLSMHEIHLIILIHSNLMNLDINRNNEDSDPTIKRDKIILELIGILNLLHNYHSASSVYESTIKTFYKDALSELNIELHQFRKLKEILANATTIQVYENAKRKYSWAFYIYLISFFTAIYATLHFSLYIIQQKNHYLNKLGMDIYDYWTIKISAIFIFITVITFLIKQATHYQKKKDEAERTMLELKALPSYLADLEPKDATNLRKDLASKYFGKNNDNSTLNEIGNIISEQLKNSTEVAKSSAEIIKTLKPKQ